MFSCEAEGNPSPDLFLLRDSYSNKLGNIDSNNQVTFKFNKTMTCQDTGVYVCQVQTQKADEKERVQVNVFCKYSWDVIYGAHMFLCCCFVFLFIVCSKSPKYFVTLIQGLL